MFKYSQRNTCAHHGQSECMDIRLKGRETNIGTGGTRILDSAQSWFMTLICLCY